MNTDGFARLESFRQRIECRVIDNLFESIEPFLDRTLTILSDAPGGAPHTSRAPGKAASTINNNPTPSLPGSRTHKPKISNAIVAVLGQPHIGTGKRAGVLELPDRSGDSSKYQWQRNRYGCCCAGHTMLS